MAYALEQDNYRSKRSYVSTGAFNGSIYSYVTALNPSTFKQEGRLAAITTSPTGVTLTATNCPAGRILRENGRKLYPGVNVGLLSGDSYQGTANFQGATEAANKFWVGVFDAVTGVKGFINPNASTFDVYNSDKSLEVVDVLETNGAGVNKNLVVSGSVSAGTTVTAVGQIRSSTVTSGTQTFSTGSAANVITIDPTLGQVQVQTFEITGGTNTFTLATAAAPAAGSVVYLILKTSAAHTTAASLAAGTNVKMNTVVLGTVASRTFGLTFVSDGTNLVQVGGDVVAVAMA